MKYQAVVIGDLLGNCRGIGSEWYTNKAAAVLWLKHEVQKNHREVSRTYIRSRKDETRILNA